MTLLPLSATPPFEVASDTSATQMWRGTRRGNHTDLNRNLLFAWAYKQIGVRFVLDSSWKLAKLLNVGHQHGKNNFWKSSWLRKEIVSHVEGFKVQTTLQKQTGIFVLVNLWVSRAAATKKPTITMTISDESHWSMSQRWLLLFQLQEPSQRDVSGRRNAYVDWQWAQLLLIGSKWLTALISFGLQVKSLMRLASYRKWTFDKEIFICCKAVWPSNSAKSCVFEGSERYQIVNESKLNHKGPLHTCQITFQLAEAQASYLWLTGCDRRKWYSDDNSGDSSSFAAKLSPWCTGGGQTAENQLSGTSGTTGREWRLRFLNLNKHVKQISSFHLESHFANDGQLKDWQPHFQPTLVKFNAQSPKSFSVLTVVTWNHRRSEYSSTNPGDHNSVTKPSASLRNETGGIFLQAWCNHTAELVETVCRSQGP